MFLEFEEAKVLVQRTLVMCDAETEELDIEATEEFNSIFLEFEEAKFLVQP